MSAPSPCISSVAYAFPAESRSVQELGAAGLLESDAAMLEQFGFARVHVAVAESPYELALRAASSVLAECGAEPDSIDLLLYGGTPALAFAARGAPDDADARLSTTERFKYPATRLQYELGLARPSALWADRSRSAWSEGPTSSL